jgi:ribose 5-phosphate isomerase B
MRVALGADHAGVALKRDVRKLLDELHVEYVDLGSDSDAPVDYPDYAKLVCREVVDGRVDAGILICGTGIGMAMAANKIHGVRAASAGDVETARLAREHNDANVLALGARTTSIDRAMAVVKVFLSTPFAGGRHARRIGKVAEMEQQS